jgi:hypothetical protein
MRAQSALTRTNASKIRTRRWNFLPLQLTVHFPLSNSNGASRDILLTYMKQEGVFYRNMNHKPTLTDAFSLSDEAGYFWLKGNLHCHTTRSDGRVSPQERVDGYAKQGYDFLAITDHCKITPIDSVRCPEGLILIQGVELHPDNPFGGQRHHFLALNVSKDIDSTAMPPQHVIDAVNEQGGSIWLAHPYWSAVNIIRDILPLRGLAGIEVFNTACRGMARGESNVHWDDWIMMGGKLVPAIANDDAHSNPDEDRVDTYQAWTCVRVKERTAEAILDAITKGASYCSTGPKIHDIHLSPSPLGKKGQRVVRAHIKCSPCMRAYSLFDVYGIEYHNNGVLFEEAFFDLRAEARYVRFEVLAPDGSKAWSNPYDLTDL